MKMKLKYLIPMETAYHWLEDFPQNQIMSFQEHILEMGISHQS